MNHQKLPLCNVVGEALYVSLPTLVLHSSAVRSWTDGQSRSRRTQ